MRAAWTPRCGTAARCTPPSSPESYREGLAQLRKRGLFPRLPFGTELTEQEIVLARALRALRDKSGSLRTGLGSASAALLHGRPDDTLRPYLLRMGLDQPKTPLDALYRRLLTAELKEQLAHLEA